MSRPPLPGRPPPSGSSRGSCASRWVTEGGPEAAARSARYAALRAEAAALGASAVLTATRSMIRPRRCSSVSREARARRACRGWRPHRSWGTASSSLRPLLAVRRAVTLAACAAEGLDRGPTRTTPIRRTRASASAPGAAGARGGARARASPRPSPAPPSSCGKTPTAFDEMIDETIEDIVEHAEAGISVSVPALAANPAALRHRIIRHVVAAEFGQSLTRAQTLEVARLVTDWSGQGPIDLPGCTRPPCRRPAGTHCAGAAGSRARP